MNTISLIAKKTKNKTNDSNLSLQFFNIKNGLKGETLSLSY